ncbi:hypothetical protein D9M70_466490 [compost metagenome]
MVKLADSLAEALTSALKTVRAEALIPAIEPSSLAASVLALSSAATLIVFSSPPPTTLKVVAENALEALATTLPVTVPRFAAVGTLPTATAPAANAGSLTALLPV